MKVIISFVIVPTEREVKNFELVQGEGESSNALKVTFEDGGEFLSQFIEMTDDDTVGMFKKMSDIIFEAMVLANRQLVKEATNGVDTDMQKLKELLDNWEPGENKNKMKDFENPNHEGNSEKYHTGKVCATSDCNNPAGTLWSSYYCFTCNVERMNRVGFERVMSEYE